MKKNKTKLELIDEKMKNLEFKKKYDKLVSDIEKLLDNEIKINIIMEKSDLSDEELIESMGVDENFWNSYSITLKELLDYKIDIQNKELYITDSIDIETPETLDVKIKVLERLGQTFEGNENMPLTINISTYGGEVYSAFAMIDIINNIKSDVTLLGRGQIMSAGAIILCCSKGKRIVTKNSVLMLHDIQSFNFGSFKEIKENFEHLKFLQEKIYKLLEESSNKDAKFWENKLQRDVYLTPEQALEYNLIDEIR
ncbi:MAG: ATP-dependent Clp protease proteolytic subunit [bacterium]